MRVKIYRHFIFILIFFLTMPIAAIADVLVKPIAIVSALSLENAMLVSQLQHATVHQYLKRRYYTGLLDKQHVVIVALGVGPVNAAEGTAILIDRFSPSAIIFSGVAGGTGKVEPGFVVMGKRSIYYDYGMTDAAGKYTPTNTLDPTSTFVEPGVKQNPLYFMADKNLFSIAKKAIGSAKLQTLFYKGKPYKPKVVAGTIVTRNQFSVYGKELNKIVKATNAYAFDMEGGAVAQVAYQQHVPYLVIRSISDTTDLAMFAILQKSAAKNAEIFIQAMLGTCTK
ncbi:MAG: 5'-methylthioadenosine/S-adenosylhomocysteine nucleosidase [Pseudomonadota bacterium]